MDGRLTKKQPGWGLDNRWIYRQLLHHLPVLPDPLSTDTMISEEEGLLRVSQDGRPDILVGSEGDRSGYRD